MDESTDRRTFSSFWASSLIDTKKFCSVELDDYQMNEQPEKPLCKRSLVFRVLSFQLALAVSCFALTVLIGYYYGIDYLYRPFHSGPATNPNTAVLCLILSILLLIPERKNYAFLLRRVFIFTTLTVTIFVLLDYLFSLRLVPSTLFFEDKVQHEVGQGFSNYLSINTDIMLLLIALSQFFECARRYLLSQLFSFFAIAIPCLSFIGYLYAIESFYGHMSFYTAIMGFCLGWASLSRTADQAGFRAVLSPFIGGKVARIQVLSGMCLPFLVGFLLLPYSQQVDKALLAVFVIFLTWFLVLMISISAMVQEQIELLRQEATEELIKAASTDPLTGLFNRRKFFELAEGEYKKAIRANRELAMLMIDVDNFKNINDLAGHNVGDSVLISISDVISDSVRETDAVCRFGGEEFAVMLFDTSQEGIERVCEKILKTVEEIKVEGWTELNGKITVSIGSSLLSKKSDLDAAIRAADKAMYKSKRSGKNQATYLH